MKIISSAFKQDQTIPSKYTCSEENISPPLTFNDLPSGTKSLALIMDDPDAPDGTFDHWITWNIPAETNSLPEGAKVPHQGSNGYQKLAYNGPCPPPGKPHHYHFKLYALDTMIDQPDGISKNQLEKAIEGHILAKAELIGIFQR